MKPMLVQESVTHILLVDLWIVWCLLGNGIAMENLRTSALSDIETLEPS